MICNKQTKKFLWFPTLNFTIMGKKRGSTLACHQTWYYFLQRLKEQTNHPKASVFQGPGSEPVLYWQPTSKYEFDFQLKSAPKISPHFHLKISKYRMFHSYCKSREECIEFLERIPGISPYIPPSFLHWSLV